MTQRTARLLIALAGLVAVLMLALTAWVVYSWQPTIVDDTEAAVARLTELTPTLRVPSDLTPRQTIDMEVLFSLPLSGVIAARDDVDFGDDAGQPDDLLVVLQMQGNAATNPALRSEALETLRTQGPLQTSGFGLAGIPEEITTVVDDRTRQAIVSTLLRPSRAQLKQSQVIIDADNGPLVLILRRPLDRFDTDEVRRLMESVPWRDSRQSVER